MDITGHQPGQHWSLLFSLNGSNFHHICSIGKKAPLSASNVVRKLREAGFWGGVGEEIQEIQVKHLQSNSFDCGIFCIMYCRALLKEIAEREDQVEVCHFLTRERGFKWEAGEVREQLSSQLIKGDL